MTFFFPLWYTPTHSPSCPHERKANQGGAEEPIIIMPLSPMIPGAFGCCFLSSMSSKYIPDFYRWCVIWSLLYFTLELQTLPHVYTPNDPNLILKLLKGHSRYVQQVVGIYRLKVGFTASSKVGTSSAEFCSKHQHRWRRHQRQSLRLLVLHQIELVRHVARSEQYTKVANGLRGWWWRELVSTAEQHRANDLTLIRKRSPCLVVDILHEVIKLLGAHRNALKSIQLKPSPLDVALLQRWAQNLSASILHWPFTFSRCSLALHPLSKPTSHCCLNFCP